MRFRSFELLNSSVLQTQVFHVHVCCFLNSESAAQDVRFHNDPTP